VPVRHPMAPPTLWLVRLLAGPDNRGVRAGPTGKAVGGHTGLSLFPGPPPTGRAEAVLAVRRQDGAAFRRLAVGHGAAG
jgi:hypothetical protein